LKAAKRAIVPDVADRAIFSRVDCLEVMLDAGARAVQSTPLIGKTGQILGMLSTHYRTVNQPARKDLLLIDYFAERAVEILEFERRLGISMAIMAIVRMPQRCILRLLPPWRSPA
jgi:hypothetical protein